MRFRTLHRNFLNITTSVDALDSCNTSGCAQHHVKKLSTQENSIEIYQCSMVVFSMLNHKQTAEIAMMWTFGFVSYGPVVLIGPNCKLMLMAN